MDFNDILSFTENALRIIPPTTNRHVAENGGECIFSTVCSKGLAIQRFFSAITAVPTVQSDGVCALSFSTTVQYRIEPGGGGAGGGGDVEPLAHHQT